MNELSSATKRSIDDVQAHRGASAVAPELCERAGRRGTDIWLSPDDWSNFAEPLLRVPRPGFSAVKSMTERTPQRCFASLQITCIDPGRWA